MKIIDSIWFCTMDNAVIGIVYGKTEFDDKEKAYIGKGNGIKRQDDEQFIAEHGTPFPVDAAKIAMRR